MPRHAFSGWLWACTLALLLALAGPLNAHGRIEAASAQIGATGQDTPPAVLPDTGQTAPESLPSLPVSLPPVSSPATPPLPSVTPPPVKVPPTKLPVPTPVGQGPSLPVALSPSARGGYLGRAQTGISGQSSRWRTAAHGWYCETLGCTGAYPLLTIWGSVRMFEALNAVQAAAPSSAHRAAVDRFAGQAQSMYWNRYLRGYDPYPGDDYPAATAWFDDNGWLGLAFIDAYRATGEQRWAQAAQKAFDFIAAHGWASGGGMWWDLHHDHLSGEALAADSLLGVLLYQADHRRSDLDTARSWIDWANSHDIGYKGLYASEGPGSTTIDYVEAPLIYAQYLLCQATGVQHYCAHAADQDQALRHIYGVAYNLAPLYDSIFFQWMMAYGKATGDTHWLAVAQANASAATHNAINRQGLWLNSWWGGSIHDPNTQPGMFRTMAGTTSLFAWVAYYS